MGLQAACLRIQTDKDNKPCFKTTKSNGTILFTHTLINITHLVLFHFNPIQNKKADKSRLLKQWLIQNKKKGFFMHPALPVVLITAVIGIVVILIALFRYGIIG